MAQTSPFDAFRSLFGLVWLIGSYDRLVDTVSVISSSDLSSSDKGGAIVHQYREMVTYFKQRWAIGGPDMPFNEDIVSIWFSYPLLDRCRELCSVMQVVFCGMLTGPYSVDYLVVGSTPLSEGLMLPSLHVVRNWLCSGYVGQSRQAIAGFLRYCNSTNMQTSGLQDVS